jgi:hypothetical protein
MKSILTLLVAAGLVATSVALPTVSADAAQYKYPRRVVAVRPAVVAAPVAAWPVVVAGPNQVVFNNRVIGTDPDPNIRAYITRDLSGFFGGDR